jgi:hypothetical protein
MLERQVKKKEKLQAWNWKTPKLEANLAKEALGVSILLPIAPIGEKHKQLPSS